jgi:hypothetical protein
MLLDIAGSASFGNPSMEILYHIKSMVSPKPIERLIFPTFPAKWIKWIGATAVGQKLLVGTERKTKASEARLLLTPPGDIAKILRMTGHYQSMLL